MTVVRSDRMGKPSPGRSPNFVVLHDAGNLKVPWDETARRTLEWQLAQRGTHSGYAAIFDVERSVYCLDPLEVRAYGAKGANDGIQICIGPGRPYSELTSDDVDDMFGRIRIFVAPYGIAVRRAHTRADARANGGYIRHHDIPPVGRKHDVRADFPWQRFLETLAG